MTDIEKVITRVKKLLALAEDSSSPNEASIALDRARKLIDKHQLSNEDFQDSRNHNFILRSPNEGSRTPNWYKVLMMSVAELNDCFSADKKVKQMGASKTECVFIGIEQDVLSCELMMLFLTDSVKKEWTKVKKELQESGQYTRSVKNHFFIGFAKTIRDRIELIVKERKEAISKNGKKNLIVLKKELIRENFSFRKEKTIYARIDASQEAFQKGAQKARSLHLGKQIEGAGQLKLKESSSSMGLNIHLPAKFSRLYITKGKSSPNGFGRCSDKALGLEYKKRIFWLNVGDVSCVADKIIELMALNIKLESDREWRNMVKIDDRNWTNADGEIRKVTFLRKNEEDIFAEDSQYTKKAMKKENGSIWWSVPEVQHYLNNEQGVLF